MHLDKKDSQHAGRQKVAARSLPKCAVGTHHNSYYASEHVSLWYLSSSLHRLVDPENSLLTLMVFVCASGWKVLTTQVVRNIQTPLKLQAVAAPLWFSTCVLLFVPVNPGTCRQTKGRFKHLCRRKLTVKEGAVHRPTACQKKNIIKMILVSQIFQLLLQVTFYMTFTNQRCVINWSKEQKDCCVLEGSNTRAITRSSHYIVALRIQLDNMSFVHCNYSTKCHFSLLLLS